MADPCTQTDRITKIEAAVGSVAEVVNKMAVDFYVLKSKVEEALTKVSDHEVTLYGQQDHIGVVARVTQAADTLDNLDTALRGEKDKPGLISKIDVLSRQMDRWDDDRKWVMRLVMGAVILGIIGLFEITVK